jgi:hypothetical protein
MAGAIADRQPRFLDVALYAIGSLANVLLAPFKRAPVLGDVIKFLTGDLTKTEQRFEAASGRNVYGNEQEGDSQYSQQQATQQFTQDEAQTAQSSAKESYEQALPAYDAAQKSQESTAEPIDGLRLEDQEDQAHLLALGTSGSGKGNVY